MEDRRVRVLIVDDQQPFREAARMVVEAADGFEVAGEAETGEASLDRVRELDPDLVLMDVNLPDMDGFQATRAVGATSSRTIVVLLSAYEANDYLLRAVRCGAASYIPKSTFDVERLEQAWTDATSGQGMCRGASPSTSGGDTPPHN